MRFKEGDHVRMFMNDIYWYGKITIVREHSKTCKVLFDSGDGPDYWYYPESELELVKEKDE